MAIGMSIIVGDIDERNIGMRDIRNVGMGIGMRTTERSVGM